MFTDYAKGVMQGLEELCFLDDMAERDKVMVFYATPTMAFAKVVANIQNGEDAGSNISIYLKSIEYNKEQTMNGYGTLHYSTDNSTVIMRAPQIYQLNFQATILCNTETEGDILQAQILMGMPFNHNYYFMIDNQYACCYAQDPENASSVEAGTGNDKFSRRTVTIIVPRAYLEYPIRELKGMVKEFNINYNLIGGSEIKEDNPHNLVYAYR
jgi:hypothetical protein